MSADCGLSFAGAYSRTFRDYHIATASRVAQAPPQELPVYRWSGQRRTRWRAVVARGPNTPAPDYSKIDAQPQNRIFTTLFAARLADELGVAPLPTSAEYADVMDLVARLGRRARGDGSELMEAAVRVLDTLFPSWLPGAFALMISRPFPGFAAWINAVVTLGVTQWLMGPSKLAEDGSMTVEIERCRYLEESGCVGTCVNSCKLATEAFFIRSMGLPLHIDPDFSDFSCKFRFGVQPPPVSEQECLSEPCFVTCVQASRASKEIPCESLGETTAPETKALGIS